MDQKQRLYLVFAAIIIVLILYFHKTNQSLESFDTFKAISAEHYLPNQNAFSNYYRVGYELGQHMGWKPSETWDHLRPEYNECPSQYRKDPIFAD